MASTDTQPPATAVSSRERAEQLLKGSLGDLLRAEKNWKNTPHADDESWKNFFSAAKKAMYTRYITQWDDEAVDENQIISDYARGLQVGEYDDAMRPLVEAVVRAKGKRTDARGTDILATIGTGVTSIPEVLKTLGVSGAEIGKTIGETVAGYGAMAYGGLSGDEYLAEEGRQMGTKAGARTATAVEGETKESLGMLRRSFPRAYDFLRSMIQSGGTPLGVIDVANSLAGYGGASILAKNREAGLAGDDEAFKTYFDTRLDEEMDVQAARLGRGELTKMIGADVDSLKRIGVEFTQEDIDRATAMGPLLDATELLELLTGIGFASSATRKLAAAAVKRAGFKAAGDVLLTAAERGIPTQRVLSRTIKTAEQVAEEARQYDTLLRKARLASGEKLVNLGRTIKQLPIPAGSPLFVAGGVLAAGGDTQDAFTAGILAGAGRYVLGSRFGVRAVGAAVEGTGKVLSKKFAVNSPWEAARRSMIDLRRDMTLGAAGGVTTASLYALDPALSPESRGSVLSSGFLMGGGGVAGAKMMDAVSYGMNFAPRLSTPDSINGEAVLPRGYADVGADRANGQAFKKLSEDSTIFLRSLQDYLGNDGIVMVATTPEEYARLANSRLKAGAVDVARSQGVTFKPEDTISGKAEVILDLSRGVNNSPGHEVTHAIMNVIEAGGGPLAEKLKAAKTAVIDNFGGVNSEGFKAIKANYEEARGREMSNDAVVDEWLAEHGSVILAGLPLGKFPGVDKGVVSNLYDAFLTFSETLRGRVDPYSQTAGAPVTSSVLQYTPSVSMLNMLENIFAAYKYEKEAIIPEAKPAKSAQEVEDAVKQQDAAVIDVGTLNPMPADLGRQSGVPVKGSISGIPAEEKPKTPVKKAPAPAAEESPAPVAEKAPAPKPQEGIYTPESKRRKLAGDQSPPEVLDENRRILDEELNKPRAERVPLQAEYNSADVEEAESLRAFEEGKQTDKLGLTQPQRLEQRRLADAGQKSGVTNALRSLYDKVFIPMSAAGSDNVFGFSIDKVIRNIDMLSQWLSENPDVANQILDEAGYQSLSDPAFVRDFQAYLQNQANGYRGDGRDIVLPEGTDPALVTEPTPGYEPKMLSERAAQLINSVMGVRNVTDWGAGAPLKKVFAIRLAELNGVPMVEQIAGVGKGGRQLRPKAEFNTMNKMLRDAGFDTNLFHVALENLRISRMGEKPLVRRPDLKNIKAPVTSYIQAGFMPAQAAKTSPGNPQAQESKKRTASMAVRSVAEDYMREAGLPYTPHEGYAPVDEDLAKRLADFYDQAESAPDDPEVQSAYRSLADETMAQYRAMEAAGIEIEPWEGKGEPYANSAEMLKDVRDNKHLWFFTTESGFGKGETAPNALLEDSGVVVNGKPLVVNDVFRAVHDYFGHAKEGYEFGPRGEFNAYLAHSRMFSDAAKPALASETLAQNSWVNFGPHLRREDGSLPKSGEEGFVSVKDRPFADQKNLVIPDELLAEADQVTGQFMPAERAGAPLESERRASMPARILVDDLPESPNYEVVPKGDPDPLGYGGSGGKFYLSPDGRWLAVEEHELAAEELLLGREKPRNKSENPSQEELELRLGWVRVLDEGSALNDGAPLYFTSQANPTQIRELRNVAIEYGRELIQDFGGRERTLYRPERGAQFMPSERAGKPLESEGLEVGRTIETDAEQVFGEGATEPQFMPAPPVESEAFKNWFGDSKVVDENGNPLVVYHGTVHATFDEFKTDRGYSFGPAAYFTPEAARAAQYAGMNHAEDMAAKPGATVEDIEGEMPKFGSPAVYPVYVSIQNPISAAAFEQLPGSTNAARNAEARRQGYDGVIKTWPANQFRPEEIVEVAAFEPTQVKSATGNRGTYDPTNPDIRYMPAPPVESEAFKKWFGNSKIVDENGEPLVVYHGTRNKFTEFETPAYFTDSRIEAREYAYGQAGEGRMRTVPVYLSVKNPKMLTEFSEFMEITPKDIEKLTSEGHDGVVLKKLTSKEPLMVAAFDPTQIKSATDNVGTYDPTNPDIRYMPAKELTTQFESAKKRGSLGGVQQLVHFSSVPMKTLDPKKSSGKGAATPTDLRGMKRGYFYRLKKGAYESGIADRPYTYMAQVDGNSIYDLAKDPLGYRGIPDREKADQMLIDAGFAGMRGKVGAIDMVAMFKPVKVTEATAEDVYTKKQLAEQRRQRAPLEEEEIDYQAEDEAWEAEKDRSMMKMREEGDTNLRVSTRLPTAVKAAENAITQPLVITSKEVLADPKKVTVIGNLLREYPMLASKGKAENLITELMDLSTSNLLWLHDKMSPELRKRARKWYDGGRRLTERWSEEKALPRQAVAGVIASLSPQKDWYMNVDLAGRVIDHLRQLETRSVTDGIADWVKTKFSDKPSKVAAIEDAVGKTWAELDLTQKAMFLRAYDELMVPRSYQTITPEGDFVGVAKTVKGVPAKVAWGDFGSIAKAISIAEDPSKINISNRLGGEHKVRNFYNNILLPNNSEYGDVTIDTHAVAAALLSPLAGSDLAVVQNLGGGGAPGSAITGASGLYGLYADAYRKAAKERGILPREMQSITWEAVRGLFSPEFKTAANKAKVELLWKRYKKGELTLDEVRTQINNLAGGIKTPSWAKITSSQ